MKQTKLYNIILPIWLLVLFPQVWLIVIPGNLAIDCLVLFVTLAALKHTQKKTVMKRLWWKFWLLGFASDAVGVVWLLLGMVPATGWFPMSSSFVNLWNDTVGNIVGNSFSHWTSFLWMLIAVTLAGVCIYFFDKRAMRSCDQLSDREKHIVALTMAIVTAPWTFFIPMY